MPVPLRRSADVATNVAADDLAEEEEEEEEEEEALLEENVDVPVVRRVRRRMLRPTRPPSVAHHDAVSASDIVTDVLADIVAYGHAFGDVGNTGPFSQPTRMPTPAPTPSSRRHSDFATHEDAEAGSYAATDGGASRVAQHTPRSAAPTDLPTNTPTSPPTIMPTAGPTASPTASRTPPTPVPTPQTSLFLLEGYAEKLARTPGATPSSARLQRRQRCRRGG